MSNLEEIQSKPKAKRILKGITFDFKGAHVAYTDGSQGGAASLKNDPYLLKAEDIAKELTKEQQEILEAIGEESTPLEKSIDVDKNAPSSSTEVVSGEDEKLSKQKEDKMSEAIEKQLAEQAQEIKVLKAEKVLIGYNFEADLNEDLAKAIAELSDEGVKAVTKALTSLKEKADEALEKANKEDSKENELEKKLSKEDGHAEAEETIEKSFLDQVKESMKAEQGVK